MKTRIYTDTSVIGGCFDIEFKEGSTALFETFQNGDAVLIISNITIAELESAPEFVRNSLISVPHNNMEFITFTEEASDLAETYLEEGVVPQKSRVDAQHIKQVSDETVCNSYYSSCRCVSKLELQTYRELGKNPWI
jgi:hypothetical protein